MGMNELTERQKIILSLVIHEYIRTAGPVGSKSLVEQFHLGCSAATVRNELAALTEMGYLHQPHTSAGRMPTEKGYRLFVSGLMRDREVPEETRRRVEHQFSQVQSEMDGRMKLAASVLADQANAISLVTAPLPRHTKLKHLALVSVTDRQVLMILVLAGGQMQQRFLYLDHTVRQPELDRITTELNGIFDGHTSEEIRRERHLSEETDGTREEILRSLLTAMYEADTLQTGEVYTDGINNVLAEPEFAESETARRSLRILDEKPVLQQFLSRTTREQQIGGVQVFFGGEGILKNLSNCSMVIARYGMQGQMTGTIGVLGPMRMAYNKNIPTVRFLAGILSDLVADGMTAE